MSGSIKFMTYNVWSYEHVAVYRRIKSICEIIEQHEPDVIFLQLSKLDAGNMVLPLYIERFPAQRFPCAGSIPSDLRSAWVYTKYREPGAIVDWQWPHLRAATCRLTSPSPSDIGCVDRRARASAFLEHFEAVHQPRKNESSFVLDENVVLGGDLGWDDDLDGPLRLGDGRWLDAWQELRGSRGGWTYDAVANPMLKGFKLPAARRRPDRFICKLRDFTLESIDMLGTEPIPDVICFDDKGDFVPVFPSHHLGLLLTIKPKHI